MAELKIYSRKDWSARKPKSKPAPMDLPAPDVWVHHTADVTETNTDEPFVMRRIQQYHMNHNGWNDIAYSFVVFPSGNVYEGRGWGVVGAHTMGYNTTSHGVCFAGNFQTQRPTASALEAARLLIGFGQKIGAIGAGYQPTGGHRDVGQTACPGNNLYGHLSELNPNTTIGEAMSRVPNPVEAKRRPGFGPEQFAIVSADGAMFCYNGAPYCSAYNAHPEWWNGPMPTSVRGCVGFEWDADGFGYTQYMDDGAFYHLRAEGH